MPYANVQAGIYKIVNTAANKIYVGQSVNVQKRLQDHRHLLAIGKHPNPHLQASYKKYGKEAFLATVEILCENPEDLDDFENAFLTQNAFFEEPIVYNIAEWSSPMRNRRHSEETRKKISASQKERLAADGQTHEQRAKKSSEVQTKRYWSDEAWVAKLKFVLANQQLSYAELGRRIGNGTSSVRKLLLKYKYLTGTL